MDSPRAGSIGRRYSVEPGPEKRLETTKYEVMSVPSSAARLLFRRFGFQRGVTVASSDQLGLPA